MPNTKIIGAVGYPSIDRIVQLNSKACVGQTSLILNDNFFKTYYGGAE